MEFNAFLSIFAENFMFYHMLKSISNEYWHSYFKILIVFGWCYHIFRFYFLIFLILPGASIFLPLLSLKLRVDDSLLGLVGCISKSGDYLIRLFADKGWYMYAGMSWFNSKILCIIHNEMFVVICSINSKLFKISTNMSFFSILTMAVL